MSDEQVVVEEIVDVATLIERVRSARVALEASGRKQFQADKDAREALEAKGRARKELSQAIDALIAAAGGRIDDPLLW